MRLLLIDPVTTAKTLPVEARRKLRQGIGYPGLGLFTVAALTPDDVEVRVIDESVEPIPEEYDPDLVGISVQGPTAPYAYELAASYRSRGIPVVLGGIHVSLNPDEAVDRADSVVVGEAEPTWPSLIQDFREGRLQQKYEANGLVDLNESPVPRRELMDPENYQIPWVVQASKGCPFACEFCSLHAFVGQRPRFRRIESVVDEIRSLPGDAVLFADDNIYASKSYARDLFRAMRPLDRRWVAETTWHIAFDDEALSLAREAGCVGLFVGFDSLNEQYAVRKIPRSGPVDDVFIEATQRILDKGLAVVAAFVFGFDSDETDVFPRSLRVVQEGGANLVNFSVLVPYPGTPVFHRFQREGRLTKSDWGQFISPNVCFEPKRMSAAELEEGTSWAQRECYSLGRVVKTALRTTNRLGWGVGLLGLKLNLAQRRNWGKGSVGGNVCDG